MLYFKTVPKGSSLILYKLALLSQFFNHPEDDFFPYPLTYKLFSENYVNQFRQS